MDLVVYDPGKPNALYDVVVTNHISLEVLATNCVNTRATRVQEQVKECRYRDAAAAAEISLHGLAIEVYGAWGNDFTNMFTHFISLGAVVTQIPKAILANYWQRRISACLQRGVANAINTRTNRLTARTLDAGSSSQGESFFPGLVEEQSEAYRDGSLIACGEEEDSLGCGTMSAWG